MLNVVLIGAGNLMTNLGKALRVAEDVHIEQVWSRTESSAKALADILSTPYETDLTLVRDADVYILAVKDSALESLIPTLTERHPNAVFLHTAGSMPMQVFSGHAKHYGVLYPMQTFSKSKEVDFKEIPVFVEASDEDALMVVRQLSHAVSDSVYELSSADRKYLHLSAVFACNFVNHCYDLAGMLLEKHHIPFEVLLPLINETARKLQQLSPKEAQTGPAVRYDENVIAAQSALLADEPSMQQVYELMSKSIAQRFAKKES